jgi:hypothetical protein
MAMNIIESINKQTHSMILCDEFSGRKYSCALGVMNKILNRIESENNNEYDSSSEDLFVNAIDVYKQSKERKDDNKVKQTYKPRGALIICQKFEFATHFYRICRKIDHKNKLRMTRLGASLHTVSPTVELDAKSMTDSEEFESQEKFLGNVNLVNTTEWKNIDILFITPQLLEYIFLQKDTYDYFDINPEIIMIDDFDYILSSEKFDVKEILLRYFGPDSKFGEESYHRRKLILTSSTVSVENLLIKNEINKSLEIYKNNLAKVTPDFYNKFDVIVSQNFMDLDYHLKGIEIDLKLFETDDKNYLDKKLRYTQNLIEHEKGAKIICCNESNIQHLKEYLRKRKLRFTSVDDGDRVGVRLFNVMLYNKYDYDVLLITPIFLKSLNLVKLQHLILFDIPTDNKTLIRLLAKFTKSQDVKKYLHILYSESDCNINMIDYLNKFNK